MIKAPQQLALYQNYNVKMTGKQGIFVKLLIKNKYSESVTQCQLTDPALLSSYLPSITRQRHRRGSFDFMTPGQHAITQERGIRRRMFPSKTRERSIWMRSVDIFRKGRYFTNIPVRIHRSLLFSYCLLPRAFSTPACRLLRPPQYAVRTDRQGQFGQFFLPGISPARIAMTIQIFGQLNWYNGTIQRKAHLHRTRKLV